MVVLILLGLGLHFLYVMAPAALLMAQVGPATYMGPRDALPETGILRARALKAAANYSENLPFFLTLGLLALVLEGANQPLAILGAQIFLIGRLIYLPVYMAGIPFLRSVVFAVAAVGLLMMGYALV